MKSLQVVQNIEIMTVIKTKSSCSLQASYRKVKSYTTNVCCNWADGIFTGTRQRGHCSLNQIRLILTSTPSTCQGN